MISTIVLMDIKDGIATLTLNRPDTRNAFDEDMIARLSYVFDELAAREDIKAVVLRGAGKSFSAGADLNWMKRAAAYTTEQNERDAMNLAAMLRKLDRMPQMTVALVHGAAMGGGLGLVACCDYAVAHKETVFALSEVRLGLIPATIAPYVLSAMGPRQCRRYFQTGEKFTGATAQELGLVHKTYEYEWEADSTLQSLLQEIRQNGARAMRDSKALCLDFAGIPVTETVMQDTASRIAQARSRDEAKEGLSAFFDKRKPSWIGNSDDK